MAEDRTWFMSAFVLLASIGAVIVMGWFTGRKQFPAEGKTILITGGSQGMGKALAKLLSRKGASIVIVARTVPKLEAALEEIRSVAKDPNKQKFKYFSADVSSSDKALEMLKQSYDWNNSKYPDSVICCAGSSHPGYFVELSDEVMHTQMDQNYWSAAYVAHAACRAWIIADAGKPKAENGAHHIVFTSSVLAFLPLAGYAPYIPAKSGLRALCEVLSQEMLLYEGQGVTIKPHCIFPATIFSPGFEEETKYKPKITKILEESDGGQTEEQAANDTLAALERGDTFATTGGLLSWVMKVGMLGGSRRNGNILQLGLEWMSSCAISIVYPLVRRSFDDKVRKFGKENAAELSLGKK